MYAFIEGVVCEKSQGGLVLMAGGVGYQLVCSLTTLQAAPPNGEIMRCYTYFSVREDAMELYGFATQEEKSLFMRLIGVSGVGPKMALSLLGAMSVHDLHVAILMDDITAISRAPGIGKKTAQRIALELRDKETQMDITGSTAQKPGAAAVLPSDAVGEAMEALLALGYSSVEARNALARVKGQSDRTDELITLALRGMASM